MQKHIAYLNMHIKLQKYVLKNKQKHNDILTKNMYNSNCSSILLIVNKTISILFGIKLFSLHFSISLVFTIFFVDYLSFIIFTFILFCFLRAKNGQWVRGVR